MQPDTVIETRSLSKVYRDFWGRQKVRALKALDLEIRRGEIFGLLGPNGSGKTTTMKLLLGLLFPTSGQALVFGQDATEVTKNERIGYLPEESYLYRFLNAEETLDFYGRLFNMPADVRRQRVGRPDRHGGARGGQAAAIERVFQGHDPPHRTGPGPDQRSRAGPAGRADFRPGPDRHPGHEGPDPEPEEAGQDGPHVQPPAGRRAGRLRPDRHPLPGRVEGVGPGGQPVEGPRRDRHPRHGPQRRPPWRRSSS